MFKPPLSDEDASQDFSRRLTRERLKRAGVTGKPKSPKSRSAAPDPDMEALRACVRSTEEPKAAPKAARVSDDFIKKLAGI